MGANFDKGNVTINVTHEDEAAVGGWQRDWANATHMDSGHGSSYRFQTDFLSDSTFTDTWVNGVHQSANSPASGNPCTTFFPDYYNGYNLLNANCRTPYGGWNTLQGGLDRTQISVNGHYDITPDVTFILQGTYTDRRSQQLLRPEPLLGTSIATVDPNDGNTIFQGFYVPLNSHWGYPGGASAGELNQCPGAAPGNECLIGELVPYQFGPRTYRQVSDGYRIRTGFEGHVFNDYKWEIGYVQQRSDGTLLIGNSGQFEHLAEELGQIPCTGAPGGCVSGAPWGYSYDVPANPINFFNEPGGMSAAQLAYLKFTSQETIYSIENYAYANISGPLYDLPAGALQGSVGVERRWEYESNLPDVLVTDGWAAGQAQPTAGGYGVTSVYGELDIPVLKNVDFAKSLDIKPSARYDHYSTFGDATTWKVGADWEVNDDIRFRGTYSTNFRAPTVVELFGGNAVSYIGVNGDPCDARAAINGNTNMASTGAAIAGVAAPVGSEAYARLQPGTTCYAQLSALGLNAAQILAYNSPENNVSKDQRGFLIGGNPNLNPEKAHQFTVGAVYTPSWAQGLSVGADYYEVTVTNAVIGGLPLSVGQNAFLQDAFASGGQNAGYASLVSRTLSDGISQIVSTNANFGINKVTGLDLEADYTNDWSNLDIPLPGSISLNLQASEQFQNFQTNPDGSTTNLLGTFNPNTELVQPRWKGTFNADWAFDSGVFHYDLQWIGGSHNQDGTPPGVGNELPDVFYHNISLTYDVGQYFHGVGGVGGELASHTTMIFGINNLLDKDPPYVAGDSICKCNTIAGSPYDFVGRFYYLRLTTKL